VSPTESMALRWDLLDAQPPPGERLTVRLAFPTVCRDVYIGIDAAHRRHVLVLVPQDETTELTERASRGIAVQTVEMTLDAGVGTAVYVEIACLEASGHAALDTVTSELVDALVSGASAGRVRTVQGVLAKWRRFWSGVPQNLLSREEQLGLFGEVWFLCKWLMPSVGPERAVMMWRGPAGARNDFEARGLGIEVKTTARVDGSHQVNGLEQLMEPSGGVLLLFSLMVRDESSAVDSLPTIVACARSALSDQPEALIRLEALLLAAKYDDAHASEYKGLKLRIRGQTLYRISERFPRLIPASFAGGVPAGVGNVTYELRLDSAGAFALSEDPLAASAVLSAFASRMSEG
jgi:hypothetical protein